MKNGLISDKNIFHFTKYSQIEKVIENDY